MAHQAVRAIVINGDKMLAMKRDKFGQHYYTLVGGGVDVGESNEAALARELMEETCLRVGAARLVFVEEAGDPFGTQYIYLCDYAGGEPQLHPASDEASVNALGQNLYQPVWLPLADLPQTVFRSESVKQAILAGLQDGFPAAPQSLAWQAESMTK